jgi:hypothetical protein
VFVARDEYAPYAEGLGVFLPRPFNPDIFVATVSRLLVARDDDREVESPPEADVALADETGKARGLIARLRAAPRQGWR